VTLVTATSSGTAGHADRTSATTSNGSPAHTSSGNVASSPTASGGSGTDTTSDSRNHQLADSRGRTSRPAATRNGTSRAKAGTVTRSSPPGWWTVTRRGTSAGSTRSTPVTSPTGVGLDPLELQRSSERHAHRHPQHRHSPVREGQYAATPMPTDAPQVAGPRNVAWPDAWTNRWSATCRRSPPRPDSENASEV
jgi:hypothetical protein